MTEPYFNASYGSGFEGVVNFANSLTDFWMVPVFLTFIFVTLVVTFSRDRQYPISAIVAFSLVVVFFGAMLFKLVTAVNELTVYVLVIGIAISVMWGIWQAR
jgi:hypothetical protein